VGRKYAVVPGQVHSRAGNQRNKPFHQLHRRKFDGCGAIVSRLFEFVDNVALSVDGKPLFGDCGPSDITAYFFKFITLMGAGLNTRVQRKA